MKNSFNIYCLIDTRCNKPFYVGKTKQGIGCRLSQHVSDAIAFKNGNSYKKDQHIRQMIAEGFDPLVELLQTTDDDSEADRLEKLWITRMLRWGFGVCNIVARADKPKMTIGARGRIIQNRKRDYVKKLRRVILTTDEYSQIQKRWQFGDWSKIARNAGTYKEIVMIQVKRKRCREEIYSELKKFYNLVERELEIV